MASDWRPLSVVFLAAASLFANGPALLAAERVVDQPPEAVRGVSAATAVLILDTAAGEQKTVSGFLAGPERIATSLHGLAGAVAGKAKLIGRAEACEVDGVLGVDRDRDLAILKVAAIGTQVPPMKGAAAYAVGEVVFVFGGADNGARASFAKGQVSGLRASGADQFLQLTSPTWPGCDGGPVLNAEGELVGLSLVIRSERAARGGLSEQAFAVPANHVHALLAKLAADGPVLPLAQLNATPGATTSKVEAALQNVVPVEQKLRASEFLWETGGAFSFSISNGSDAAVRDVKLRVVFFDKSHKPLDTVELQYPGAIQAGLAKRISGESSEAVRTLTSGQNGRTPQTPVEIRIFDFKLGGG